MDVTRNGDLSKTSTVGYFTSDGAARAGSDYVLTAGVLTFAPGESVKTISIPILNDNVGEPEETFNIILNNPTNATLPRTFAQITIIDDDANAILSFDQTSLSVREDVGTANVVVHRTGNTSSTVTVDYGTCQFCFGGATAGLDYIPAAGTLTFNPGETVKTIPIRIVQDGVVEQPESFGLTLQNAVGATLINATTNITINDDDDTSGVFAFDPPAVRVSEHAGSAVLTVVRGDATGAVAIRYDTTSVTATQNVDYVGQLGAVQFAPGESRQTITIPILEDSIAEGPEAFSVRLFSTAGTILTTATVTIVDDDSLSFTIDNPKVVEGNSGTRAVVFTVTPSGPVTGFPSIAYATADETAAAGSDYVATSGTLTWPSGDSTPRTIAVIVNGDTQIEDDETFLMSSPRAERC